ncbi:hypothetical protein AE1304_15430 [Aeromonas enteropelogenes]
MVYKADVNDVKQPINISTSTVLTGVIELVDSDIVTLSMRMLGRVLVELKDGYIGGIVFR